MNSKIALLASAASVVWSSVAFADTCVISFDLKPNSTSRSCNGQSLETLTTYGGTPTSNQNLSYQISSMTNSGYKLVTCLFYDHGGGEIGRECYFTR
jgi:hypothetical protein